MLLKSIRARVGNPLEWSTADRVLLGTLIALPWLLIYAVLGHYLLDEVEIMPYINRAFARPVVWVQSRIFIPAWLILMLAALWARRRAPESPLLVHALALLYFIFVALCSYFFGSHTSLYTGLVVLGGAAYGFLCFEPRPVLLGIATFVAIISTTTLLEQFGLLPYAPLLHAAPFANGRLATSWLIALGIIEFTLLVSIIEIMHYIVGQWRDRDRRLAVASEQLSRANDVISRYVASQLAQQIRAGHYDIADRHDRKRITLFFSDIKDFAETADRMEPEDLSEILNEYLSEMAVIGERYGGTIDKFVGDAVMIFFGAPVSTNDRDNAVRAIRMAMEMQGRTAELRERWLARGFERPFEVRIGINTGQASIGNFGSKQRMDYTAIGRQVNLAARLQAHCEPGKILVSHSTFALVQDVVLAVPRGEITVKGFQNPVRVYEVVGYREPSTSQTAVS